MNGPISADDSSSDLNLAVQYGKQLLDENTELTEQIKNLTEENDELKRKNVEYDDKIHELDTEIISYNYSKFNYRLNSKLSGLYKIISESENEMQSLQTDLENERHLSSIFKESLEKGKAYFKSEQNELIKVKEELEEKLSQANEENKNLRNELLEYHTRKQTAEGDTVSLEDIQIETEQYRTTAKKLEIEVDSLKQEITMYQNLIKTKENDLKRANREVQDVSTERDEYKKLYLDLKEENFFTNTARRSIRFDELAPISECLGDQVAQMEDAYKRLSVRGIAAKRLEYVYNAPIGCERVDGQFKKMFKSIFRKS